MAGFSPTLRLASLGLLLLARETSADASRTGWTEVRTAHVTVKTDLSPKSARGAALLAEESRAALLAAGWPGTRPLKDRIELVVFSDHQDFEGYFGDFVRDKVLLGDYPPVVFLYGAPEAWEKRRLLERSEKTSVLRQALAEHLAYFFYRRQPKWFSTGLAEFLETVHLSEDGKSVILGDINLRAMRDYFGHRTFGVADALAWGSTLDPQDEGSIRGLTGLSWVMVFWMYNTHLPEFVRFQELLGTGLDPAKAWKVLFPTLANGDLDRQLFYFSQYGQLGLARFPISEAEATVESERPMSTAEVHVVRAEAALAAGKAKDARAEVSAALAADKDNAAALRRQMPLLAPVERLALARRLVAAHPEAGLAWLALGDALAEGGASEEGTQAYRRATELRPDHPLALGALASLAQKEGRPREALSLAQEAVRMAPWDAALLDTLASALVGLGRCSEAVGAEARAADRASEKSGPSGRSTFAARLDAIQKDCVEAPAEKPPTVALRLRVFIQPQPFNNDYRFVLYDNGLLITQRTSKEEISEYFSVELTPQEVASFLGSLPLGDFIKLASESTSPAATALPLFKIAAYDSQAGKLREVAISNFDAAAAEPSAFARLYTALDGYRNVRERRWFPEHVYLTLSKAAEPAACTWPSEWENFETAGSMPMPDRPQATSSELGIIRVHGERLTDLQRLLRKCRHLFVFQGQPVLMKLAVTLPHEREGS